MDIYHSEILSTASYLPGGKIFNTELTQFSAGHVPLIKEKTGIESRHYAEKDEAASDLAIKAAQLCLESGTLRASELEAIILATSTPDRIMPATATTVQAKLGAVDAFAFDINSVCSGAVYAIDLADAMIKSGRCKNVLVIASDVYSKILNPKDFTTYPYFGDGAGAVLLERSDKKQSKLIYSILRTDGRGSEVIQVPAGGSKIPGWCVENMKQFYFRMSGRKVYNFAVEKGSKIIIECVKEAGYTLDDIRCIIAHQASINVLNDIATKIGVSFDRFFVNLQKYGNTAGASVIIALDEAIKTRKIEKGDLFVLAAFGGGLSWGAILARY